MLKKSIYIIFILILTYIVSQKALSYEQFDGRYHYNQNNQMQDDYAYGNKEEEILLIVDFSKSMNQQLGYSARYIQAIDAINTIVRKLPSTTRIGLRVFGIGTNSSIEAADTDRDGQLNYNEFCTASRLVLPINSNNNYRVPDKLSEYRPRGATPIYYSLRQAVENDFKLPSSKKRIVLVTDGRENCGGDPCRYIKTVMSQRDDIVIDVIGITIDKNSYSQLNCIATYGGGKYYNIQNPGDFNVTFKNVFASVPQYPNNYQNPSTDNNMTSSSQSNEFKYGFSSSPQTKQPEIPNLTINNKNKKKSIIKYSNYSFEFDI